MKRYLNLSLAMSFGAMFFIMWRRYLINENLIPEPKAPALPDGGGPLAEWYKEHQKPKDQSVTDWEKQQAEEKRKKYEEETGDTGGVVPFTPEEPYWPTGGYL